MTRRALWAGATAATLGLGAVFVWSAFEYGGEATWPSFATGGLATALGVFLALVVEREVSLRRDSEATAAMAAREADQRRSEARLAFGALAEELRILERGLVELRAELPRARFVGVELPTGSWRAVDERLGRIVGEFELLSGVARCYGRVDDVQRGLATRELAALGADPASFAGATEAVCDVIDSALVGIQALQPRVAAQIVSPTVRT